MKTVLTGIKPTGTPHLGNYFGAIRPALALAENPQHRALYFVADYHAFTTVRDAAALRESVYEVTATWLACGLDPSRITLFQQSRVAETFELCWVLMCCLSSGQLERGHAYKSALDRGEAPNGGVFAYPALMAADILLYDVDQVPVGQDQKQHVEVARDVALRFNHAFGDTLRVPNVVIGEAPLVPGLDGRKMSKSYDNTVPLFLPQKELRAAERPERGRAVQRVSAVPLASHAGAGSPNGRAAGFRSRLRLGPRQARFVSSRRSRAGAQTRTIPAPPCRHWLPRRR